MCHQTHLAIWTITDFLTFVQLRNSEMINYENISHNVAITNLGQKTKNNFISRFVPTKQFK